MGCRTTSLVARFVGEGVHLQCKACPFLRTFEVSLLRTLGLSDSVSSSLNSTLRTALEEESGASNRTPWLLLLRGEGENASATPKKEASRGCMYMWARKMWALVLEKKSRSCGHAKIPPFLLSPPVHTCTKLFCHVPDHLIPNPKAVGEAGRGPRTSGDRSPKARALERRRDSLRAGDSGRQARHHARRSGFCWRGGRGDGVCERRRRELGRPSRDVPYRGGPACGSGVSRRHR